MGVITNRKSKDRDDTLSTRTDEETNDGPQQAKQGMNRGGTVKQPEHHM